MANTQLRKQLFDKQDLGDHARDTQGSFDQLPRFITKRFDEFYKEPMVLASPIEGLEPESIELTRVINLNAAETPVLCGQMVHYAWKPQQGGAVVTSIDGLTPSSTVRYRFTFRFTFTAKVGIQ